MASKKPAGVSSKLLGLKFMQRAQAKEDLACARKMKEEQVKAQLEEKFVLENKTKGCVVLEDDFVMQSSGRMSFMNYNPDVDALNEEHQDRVKQTEVDKAEQDDVSAKEMAQVLGKRKQLPAGSFPAADQNTSEAAAEDPSQPSPSKSPKTNHQRKKPNQESKSRCDSQDGEGAGGEGRKPGGKSPKGKSTERRAKKKLSGVRGCEPTSLRATPAGVS